MVLKKDRSGIRGQGDLVGQWGSEGWQRGSLFTILACLLNWEAGGLLMEITESFITQTLPSTSPLSLLVWLFGHLGLGGSKSQRARCKLWKEAGHTCPRDSLFILPFTFCSHFTGTELNYGGWANL